uniref:Uncharacterized protein n=1 Tax=Streptomyces sp. FR1 TaxID=349971 RepID=V9Z4M7_9ACTN|nr:hypothetical protein pFRL3_301c [Streptomyces sp. FR1]
MSECPSPSPHPARRVLNGASWRALCRNRRTSAAALRSSTQDVHQLLLLHAQLSDTRSSRRTGAWFEPAAQRAQARWPTSLCTAPAA